MGLCFLVFWGQNVGRERKGISDILWRKVVSFASIREYFCSFDIEALLTDHSTVKLEKEIIRLARRAAQGAAGEMKRLATIQVWARAGELF